MRGDLLILRTIRNAQSHQGITGTLDQGQDHDQDHGIRVIGEVMNTGRIKGTKDQDRNLQYLERE